MRLPTRTTVAGERALGDHIVGTPRHAEIRAAIANHHVCQQRPLRVRAFAIRAGHAAFFPGMGEPEAPTIASQPFELIGEERHREACFAQSRTNDAIEAVGDDLYLGPVSLAELEKCWKARVDTES